MILLAGYFLHESSAPHQKHLMSFTHWPQEVFLCEQVFSGDVVGTTVLGASVLLVVTGAVVVFSDELEKVVEERGIFVVEVVEKLFAKTLRHKQIQSKTENPMFLMLISLQSLLVRNGKMKI